MLGIYAVTIGVCACLYNNHKKRECFISTIQIWTFCLHWYIYQYICFLQTFLPETTDIYDKKNMPRVIYCLHALSTHLFKLGKAPPMQDLYGKVNFSGMYFVLCNII